MDVMDRVANLLFGSSERIHGDRCIALNPTLDLRQQVPPVTTARPDSLSFRECFSTCALDGKPRMWPAPLSSLRVLRAVLITVLLVFALTRSGIGVVADVRLGRSFGY